MILSSSARSGELAGYRRPGTQHNGQVQRSWRVGHLTLQRVTPRRQHALDKPMNGTDDRRGDSIECKDGKIRRDDLGLYFCWAGWTEWGL